MGQDLPQVCHDAYLLRISACARGILYLEQQQQQQCTADAAAAAAWTDCERLLPPRLCSSYA